MQPLTIIVPCYNSQDFISETLAELDTFLTDHEDDQVVLVDDGSSDSTIRAINVTLAVLENSERFKLVVHPQNRGKGGAIKTGMNHVHTELVCFTDADLAYDLGNLDRMRHMVEPGTLVIANRVHPKSVYSFRPAQFGYIATRHQLSRLMNTLMSRVLRLGISDIQAGLKLGYTDCFRELAATVTRAQFAFDLELLVIARAKGARLVEAPVYYSSQDAGTTVHFLSDSLRFGWDAFRVAWRQMTGTYQ